MVSNVQELIKKQEKGVELLQRIESLQMNADHCKHQYEFPAFYEHRNFHRKGYELRDRAVDLLYLRYQKLMKSLS